jgi:hypothetical protein
MEEHSPFRARWRPWLGWVGLNVVAFQGIGLPVLNAILSFFGRASLPYMPAELFWASCAITLGTAGLRTIDKLKQPK